MPHPNPSMSPPPKALSTPPTPSKQQQSEQELESFNEYLNPSRDCIWTNDNEIMEKLNSSKYNLFSINIRSLTKNFSQLQLLVQKYKPDFLALSEIYYPYQPAVALNGYNNIFKTRNAVKTTKGCGGGGVCLYLSDSLKYSPINFDGKLLVIEAVGAHISQLNIVIVSIYRPPNSKISDTLQDLDYLIKEIGDHQVILAGDLNIDFSKNNYTKKQYEEKLLSLNLIQYVKAFTRITSNTATIIDHIASNIRSLESMVIHSAISDHQTVIASWGSKPSKTKTHFKEEAKDQKRIHYKNTAINLGKVDWKSWSIQTKNFDSNKTYDSFHSIIQASIEYEPTKPKKLIPIQPWMNQDLLQEKIKVDKAWKRFLHIRNKNNEMTYKNLLKTYKKKTYETKNQYFQQELRKASKDGKKTWNLINLILGRKSKSKTKSKITFENRVIEDNLETAEILSTHYKFAAVNKIKDLNTTLNFQKFLDKTEKCNNSFDLKQITREDTWRYIKLTQPKSSSGWDGISSKLLNMVAPVILTPLTVIINKSFADGCFPEKLKTAQICPIHKKGDHHPSNYRPINLLPACSKILEKAHCEQLENHIKNNYKDERQFAYKKHHSCVHPLILTRHLIEKQLRKGNYVLLVIVDLSLAFDLVQCDTILPAKLRHYGATDKTVEYFNNFFTNRKHFVTWNNVSSKPTDLFNHSCVQGSSTGPIIYNLYTMDLNNISSCETIMFADDNSYIKGDKIVEKLFKDMNTELDTIQEYFTENTLLTNKQKTYYMLYEPKNKKKFDNNLKLWMKETELQRVSEIKFLGVWLDDKLNFSKQFEELKKKLEDAVKALICARNTMNYKTKLLVYNALFKPHLEYCSITYMDKLNKSQLESLFKLQKQAIRLIFNAKRNVHTDKLFKLSKITPLVKLYEIEAIKFIFKNVNETTKDQQPLAIRNLITGELKPNMSTRLSEDNLKITMPKESIRGQVLYDIINAWNTTKEDYRKCGNIISLKRLIHEDVMESLEPCMVKSCFICSMDRRVNYEKYMDI